jgi:predicted DNA-binding transcriptional regulator YafY
LTEKFPLAEQYLKKVNDNKWILKTEVCSYEGIGRFVVGLLHDIKVIQPDEFKNFLKKKLKLYEKSLIMS